MNKLLIPVSYIHFVLWCVCQKCFSLRRVRFYQKKSKILNVAWVFKFSNFLYFFKNIFINIETATTVAKLLTYFKDSVANIVLSHISPLALVFAETRWVSTGQSLFCYFRAFLLFLCTIFNSCFTFPEKTTSQNQ